MSEVAAILLHQNVRGRLRRTEERMLCAIDAHRLGNPRFILVALGNFPTQGQLPQRQPVGGVAIDFVRRDENKGRFRANLTRSLEKIQRAVRVNGEISLRFARRPIMRRLRGGMHHGGDVVAMLSE